MPILNPPCFSSSSASMECVEFEPEYNPQAVTNYYSCGIQVGRSKDPGVTDLILKAKKHLSAIGWSFFYITKKPGRRELRYRSPAGKTYISLRTACQGIVDHKDGRHCRDFELGCSKIEGFTDRKTKLRKNDGGLSNNRPKKNIRIEDVEALYFKQEKVESYHPDGLVVNSNHLGVVEIEKNEGFTCRNVKRIKKSGQNKNDIKPVNHLGGVEIEENEGFTRRKVEKVKKSRQQTVEIKPKKRIRMGDSSSTGRRCVLSLLIQKNIVLPGSKVSYRSKKDGRIMAKGRVYDDGIQCDCCGEFFFLSKFEAHAGSTYHRPAANIFLDDGRSLFDCQTQLTRENKSFKSSDCVLNDDFCSFCNDGGNLVLCDSCTSSFHAACIGLNQVPDSDFWFCPSCCCGICQQGQISNFTSHESTQIKCQQCEHKFHTDCLRKNGVLFTQFCSENCERIFSGLMGIAGKSFPVTVDNNLSWSLLKLCNNKNGRNDFTNTYSKLNVALDVMHECFEPVKHPWTAGDLVENVIFGRCSTRSDFSGFFTAVLERDEEVITVVTVRVHGGRVAEIPFVGTRFRYRRVGMCRILMAEVERRLTELGVERVVLPAVREVVGTWTGSFGFSVMTEADRLSLVDCRFLDFPATVKCQKVLKKR